MAALVSLGSRDCLDEARRDQKEIFEWPIWQALVGLSACFFWISVAITHYSNLPRPVALLAVLLFAAAYALPFALSPFCRFSHSARSSQGRGYSLSPLWRSQPSSHFCHRSNHRDSLGPIPLFPRGYPISNIAFGANRFHHRHLHDDLPSLFRKLRHRGVLFPKQTSRSNPVEDAGNCGHHFVLNAAWGQWRVQQVQAEIEDWPTAKITQLQQDLTMEERMQKAAAGARSSGGRDRRIRFPDGIGSADVLEAQDDPLIGLPRCSLHMVQTQQSTARIRCRPRCLSRRLHSPRPATREHVEDCAGIPSSPRHPSARRWVSGSKSRSKLHRSQQHLFINEEGVNQIYNKMVLLPFGEPIPSPRHSQFSKMDSGTRRLHSQGSRQSPLKYKPRTIGPDFVSTPLFATKPSFLTSCANTCPMPTFW